MTPQEFIIELRDSAKFVRKAWPDSHETVAINYDSAADLIDRLSTELATAGEQLRTMREALDEMKTYAVLYKQEHEAMYGYMKEDDALELLRDLHEAELALLQPPTAAELRARENADLAAQVPGLAEQVRAMREAVKVGCEFIDRAHVLFFGSLIKAEAMGVCAQLSEAYHGEVTTAEAKAAENAEKAAKWDEAQSAAVALDEKLSSALKDKVGFAPKDFEIACALLGALIEAAFERQAPDNGLVCSAVLSDGTDIFIEARMRNGEPYVKKAEEWREKAARFDRIAGFFTTGEMSNEQVVKAIGPIILEPMGDALRAAKAATQAEPTDA